MSSITPNINSGTNYADILGIKNKWAPIVFAIIYFGVFIYYTAQAVRNRSLIFTALAFFSILRIISFSLRAAIANNTNNAQHNGAMAVAYSIIYSVGFFSLLLSAYRLLTNRQKLAKVDKAGGKFSDMFHKSRIVDILVFIAVLLGVVGLIYEDGNHGNTNIGDALNSTATYIFFAVVLIIIVMTFGVVALERKSGGKFGNTNQHAILFIVALLLLLRTLYFCVTVTMRSKGESTGSSAFSGSSKNDEHVWYPLAALTELLIAALFIVPNMVPVKKMAKKAESEVKEKMPGTSKDNQHLTGNGPHNV